MEYRKKAEIKQIEKANEIKKKFQEKLERIQIRKEETEKKRIEKILEKDEEHQEKLKKTKQQNIYEREKRKEEIKARKEKYQMKLKKVNQNRENLRLKMAERREINNENMSETIKRSMEIVLQKRFYKEQKLLSKIMQEKRKEHIDNPTGILLSKKDEIINKFNIKKSLLSEIENFYFSNQNQKQHAIDILNEISLKSPFLKELVHNENLTK